MNGLKGFTILVLVFSLILATVKVSFSQGTIVPGEYYNMSDYEKLSGKKITKFSEAPQLLDLVKQGKLPSVDQRLPRNPLIVTPVEEIGQYGGNWHRVWLGLSDQWGPNKICTEHLVMFDKSGTKVLPNVAES